jgi:triosephosphate isomerase
MRKFLIAGNWKMNKGPQETQKLLENLKDNMASVPEGIEVLVCPPFISLTTAVQTVESTAVEVGAQDIHFEDNGSYTGEISTQMLTEVGCSHVIVGHSERREYFGETDALVNKKVKKALSADLHPVVCVGESLEQRENDRHKSIVKQQVETALKDIDEDTAGDIIFAYEPLWAIGTGKTASPEQAEEMHAFIRQNISSKYDEETADGIRILYGGSMKPENARGLLSQPDIDGGLIGGASLKADSFVGIIEIAVNLNPTSG